MNREVPVIIEAALNGETSRRRNPNVPRTPEEIASDARRCLEAGAAILHNHNDDPVLQGSSRHSADPYLRAWQPVLDARPDALFYPTMGGGGSHVTCEERYAHLPELCDAGVLRIGLVDPGSVNIGGFDADKLPAAVDVVYQNTLADARYMFDVCRELQLGPSLSIFEPGFLRVVIAYHRAGSLPRGALVKLYFGGERALFGLPGTERGLEAYLEMLNGSGLPWSVALLGGDLVESGLARLALERGGHLRVGLEDYAGPGTPTNEELIRGAVELAGKIGRQIASPVEAAEILDLPRKSLGSG
jgi:uncharacterized protein (DUF849 family)